MSAHQNATGGWVREHEKLSIEYGITVLEVDLRAGRPARTTIVISAAGEPDPVLYMTAPQARAIGIALIEAAYKEEGR